MPAKISIIGAGNVGAACAQRIAEKGDADIVLVDIVPGLAQGKALDISQSAAIVNFDTSHHHLRLQPKTGHDPRRAAAG
jgi:malate/lactate dehydrogenase